MRFLLDTNVVIALTKRRMPLTERVFQNRRRDYGVSSIVAHELLFGAFRSDRSHVAFDAFDMLRIPIVDFTLDDAHKAAEIRATLTAAGTPIGPYDVLIAGQALARDLTLVTRNIREFSRVPNLRVENWENGNP